MITLSIMLANIMQGVDNTILNVALPHIQGSLSASLDQIAWALTSYIVCAAIMMPLTGWLAGRFGIKYIFLASILGPIMGPALGGWVTEDYSWRWIFYINLPVGVLCTLGVLIFIRQTRYVHREP